MAQIYTPDSKGEQDLISDLNAIGFESRAAFVATMQVAVKLVNISGLEVANGVLDAQRAQTSAAIETQKNANNAAIAALRQELAQLAAQQANG